MTSLKQETVRLAFEDIPEPRPRTKLSYGLPFTDACANHVISTFGGKSTYIIASRSLSKQTSHLKSLEKALGPKHVGTWIGIPPHTHWNDLVPIINDMRQKQAQILISLGGSSIADGCKAVVYALANGVKTENDILEIVKPTQDDLSRGDKLLQRDGVGKDPQVSMIFIPTSLSGGEYSRYAGGTNPITHQKDQLTHEGMYASLVILDPQLTLTTPFDVWIQSGCRGIDHCVEGLCSIRPQPEATHASMQALKLLLIGLLKTIEDPQDLDARLQTQIGSNLSLASLAQRVVKGASHGIGHQLGPLGVGHGHTSCVLLPAVMKYNAIHAKDAKNDVLELQANVKAIMWNLPEVATVLEACGLEERTSDLGDALRAVFNKLGMPSTLQDVGIPGDKIEGLVTTSLNDPYVLTNPVPLNASMVLEILNMVSGNKTS
jgi:alcohol dehydrogenase class IV